jgi:hypothetical protein
MICFEDILRDALCNAFAIPGIYTPEELRAAVLLKEKELAAGKKRTRGRRLPEKINREKLN